MNCQARNARDRQQRRQALLQNQPPALNTNTVNAIYPVGRASLPLAFIDQQAYWRPLELGTMNVLCPSCEAKHWINERSPPSSKTAPRFESCCKKGDVALSKLSTPPDVLRALVSEDTVEGKHFRKNIRKFNSALSFTSLKYTPDTRTALLGPGIQCFQIHGELYHIQGPIEPRDGSQPQFAQLFLYDPQYAAGIRHQERPELMENIL